VANGKLRQLFKLVLYGRRLFGTILVALSGMFKLVLYGRRLFGTILVTMSGMFKLVLYGRRLFGTILVTMSGIRTHLGTQWVLFISRTPEIEEFQSNGSKIDEDAHGSTRAGSLAMLIATPPSIP